MVYLKEKRFVLIYAAYTKEYRFILILYGLYCLYAPFVSVSMQIS